MLPIARRYGVPAPSPYRSLPIDSLRRPSCPLRSGLACSRHTQGALSAQVASELLFQALDGPRDVASLGSSTHPAEPLAHGAGAALQLVRPLRPQVTSEQPAHPEASASAGTSADTPTSGPALPSLQPPTPPKHSSRLPHTAASSSSSSSYSGAAGGSSSSSSSSRQRRPVAVISPQLLRLARELVLSQSKGGVPPMRTILLSAELTNADARQLLTCLGKMEADDIALAVFRCMRDAQHPAWAHDPVLYTKLMQMLGRRPGGAAAALDLYEEMQRDGVAPDLVAYNCALAAAGKAGRWGKVQAVLCAMEAAGVPRDAFTYTSILAACQLSGRWQQALSYFEELEAAGLEGAPNVMHYTTLMSALQRAGKWEAAVEVFRKMEGAGVEPDVRSYNAAITACATGHEWERAWALFADMRRAGMEPSAVSYNALISACERCGQVDRALEVFGNMQRKGTVQPSAVTFNTLISACGKGGRYGEAVALHRQMREAGLPDDVFTLASLVKACEKAGGGRWREALRHFEDFRMRGVPPNTVAYNALISALGSAGQWEAALQAFDAMRADPDPSVQPDVVTYGAVLAALERGGQWRRALEVYDQMQAEGRRANGYIITSMLNACEQGGQWERAGQLFKAVQESDIGMDSMTMVARKALYAFPWLISTMPAPLVQAARASVEAGRAARRWIAKRKKAGQEHMD